jgi:serine/threonine-protein kinase SRPK3
MELSDFLNVRPFKPKLVFDTPMLISVEDVQKYHNGGFHPVQLNDVLRGGNNADNSYRIVAKLGHGGYATVWLAEKLPDRSGWHSVFEDEHHLDGDRETTWVAIKIVMADCQFSNGELKILQYLTPGTPGVATILDHFYHAGPNGCHLCLVTEVMGPCLYDILKSRRQDCLVPKEGMAVREAQNLGMQIAQAVRGLHEKGVVHAGISPSISNAQETILTNVDITPMNLLFHTQSLDRLSHNMLMGILGQPVIEELSILQGDPPGYSAPPYVVNSVDPGRLTTVSLLQSIKLIDFGQSFHIDNPINMAPGTPLAYAAPEADFTYRVGKEWDIWSLACTIWELRFGHALFNVGTDFDDWITQIVLLRGRLPEDWWRNWSGRGVFPPEGPSELILSMHSLQARVMNVTEHHTTLAEVGCFCDLLGKMLTYDINKRLTIKEVCEHPWFTTDFDNMKSNTKQVEVEAVWKAACLPSPLRAIDRA